MSLFDARGPATRLTERFGNQLTPQLAMVRIAVTRQFRSWRWWWLLLVAGQILFAAIIFFAFSKIFPSTRGQGGSMTYALSVYAGILVWSLFQDNALQGANLFRDHRSYIMRFSVPLWIYAVGTACLRTVVLLVGVVLLCGSQVLFVGPPSWRWLVLLLFLPVLLALALGTCWLAAVGTTLQPRAQQMLPHLLLLWFFATPVVYPRSFLPDDLALMAALNPFTHVVECFQWIFIPARTFAPVSWAVTLLVTGIVFCSGLAATRLKRRALVDLL